MCRNRCGVWARPIMAARRPIGPHGQPRTKGRWWRLWNGISTAVDRHRPQRRRPGLRAICERRYVIFVRSRPPGFPAASCTFRSRARSPRSQVKSLILMKKTGSPSSVPWSVPVAVENIPDPGLHIAIDAPAVTRAKLAALAPLRKLPQLPAVSALTRQGAEVHVAGQVSARVSQTCVVTLEPVESDIQEAVDLKFAPAPA